MEKFIENPKPLVLKYCKTYRKQNYRLLKIFLLNKKKKSRSQQYQTFNLIGDILVYEIKKRRENTRNTSLWQKTVFGQNYQIRERHSSFTAIIEIQLEKQ